MLGPEKVPNVRWHVTCEHNHIVDALRHVVPGLDIMLNVRWHVLAEHNGIVDAILDHILDELVVRIDGGGRLRTKQRVQMNRIYHWCYYVIPICFFMDGSASSLGDSES